MNRRRFRLAGIAVVCLSLIFLGTDALAGPLGGARAFRSASKGAARAIRGTSGFSGARTPSRSVAGLPRNLGSRGGNGNGLRTPGLNPLARGLNNALRTWGGGSPFGGPFGGGYGDPYRWQHDAAEEYADAYRDAAIANAVVGLAGVLVNAHVQQQALRTAPPVVAVQPAGQYVTQRTLVREGYYENREVWVPEHPDPVTGAMILGHTEIQRIWVPPVYQESQVYVPAQAQPVVYTTGGTYAACRP